MIKSIVCLFLTSCLLISCQQDRGNITKATDKNAMKVELMAEKKVSTMPKKNSSSQVDVEQLSFTATVKFMNLEGGFFGLVSKEGKHWLPMNLKKEFQQHGAVIKVKGNVKKGMMTIQQWGTPFSITHVELIKAGKKLTKNNLL